MLDAVIECYNCREDFRIDYTTGENLDLDNDTPVCPSCDWAHENEKSFEKPVDKDKTRDTINKAKTKFEVD